MTHEWECRLVAAADIDVKIDPMSAQWIVQNSVGIGPMVMLPKRFVARVEEPDFDVEVEVVADIMGPRAHRVSVTERAESGAGVRSELLRQVPVAAIVSAAAKRVVWLADGDGGGALFTQLRNVPEVVKREWPNGDLGAFLRYVSAIYLIADALGDGPTAAVAAAFGVSRATAGRYVEAARKQKLLPPVEKVSTRPATAEERAKLFGELAGAPTLTEDGDGHFIISFDNGDEVLAWIEEPFSGWKT